MCCRLENIELPFNAFAFKLDRAVGNGLLDKCILYKARASVVNLADIAPGVAWAPVPTPIPLETLRKHKVQKTQHEHESGANSSSADITMDDPNSCNEEEIEGQEGMIAVDSVGTELPAATDSVLPAQPPANSNGNSNRRTDKKHNKSRKVDEGGEDDTGFAGDARDARDADVDDIVDEAFSLARSGAHGAGQAGADDSVEVPLGAEIPAICIELVGNRFLRRMVRILTVRSAIFMLWCLYAPGNSALHVMCIPRNMFAVLPTGNCDSRGHQE